MKNIKNYAEEVKDVVEKITGMEARIVQRLDNNGEQRTGITIVNPDSNISPIVYLTELDTNRPINETASGIISVLQQNQKPDFDFEIDQFTDFKQAKNRIIMCLINKEKNSELLKDMPHIDVAEDLSIIFYYNVKNNGGQSNIKILNDHLQSCWPGRVTVNDLYKAAKINTPNLYPAEILSMSAYMSGITGDLVPDTGLYIMTNRQKFSGAAVVFYPRVCDEFCSMHDCDKLIILPSSIHELLIYPVKPADNINEMAAGYTALVKEVNVSGSVEPNDFLSDHVYLYDRLTKEITMLHTEK